MPDSNIPVIYTFGVSSSFNERNVVIFQAREWPLSVTAEVVIAVVQDGTFALKVIKQLTPCMQGTL